MSHLTNPSLTAGGQLIHLETCLHTIVQEGFNGFHAVRVELITELTRLLNAQITILLDQPRFILIIHNHNEKLAVLGNVQPQNERSFEITLDGHTVNNGSELMATIHSFI